MEKNKKIKGVLFDLDGTLTRPGLIDFNTIKKGIGCPPEIPILEFIETKKGNERISIEEFLNQQEIKSATMATPNDGAEDCVLKLKEMGLKLGIFTRNSLESTLLTLKRLPNISEKDFCVIISREDIPPKPHPYGIIRACHSMGINPHELIFVGDYKFDVDAGIRAGAISVFLANGNGAVFPFNGPNPHYIIDRLSELPALIESLS